MAGNWVKLHRKIRRSPIWRPDRPELTMFFINLLLDANWTGAWFCGQWIEPGQVVFSYPKLAKRYKVGKATIERWIKFLQQHEAVTLKAGRRFSVITICNWLTYQKRTKRDREASGKQAGSDREVTGKCAGTIEEGYKKVIRREQEDKGPQAASPGAPRGQEQTNGQPPAKEPTNIATPAQVLEITAELEPAPVRDALREWCEYKRGRREGYRPKGLRDLLTVVRRRIQEHGQQAVQDAFASAMANNYAGWDHRSHWPTGAQNGKPRANHESQRYDPARPAGRF